MNFKRNLGRIKSENSLILRASQNFAGNLRQKVEFVIQGNDSRQLRAVASLGANIDLVLIVLIKRR
ncbi:hypothetical protein [Cellvibrio sp. NN19]|uniref:hypothetical protein n=1 Tax=Cellvibrio chitinivorans TaxID=3102792 RepID=UPI002B416DDC|nr:hypothetical protein [Cellvibrio sp. NN19]